MTLLPNANALLHSRQDYSLNVYTNYLSLQSKHDHLQANESFS